MPDILISRERRRAIAFAVGLLITLAVNSCPAFALSAGQSVSIGKANGDPFDFNTSNVFRDTQFVWVVGKNNDWSTFPAYLSTRSTAPYWDPQGGAVQSEEIDFTTTRSVKKLSIQVVKAGAETLLMSFDGVVHRFTAGSIGSGEGGKTGVADLKLMSVPSGSHSLRLSLADDGAGNGRCMIDAIRITAN